MLKRSIYPDESNFTSFPTSVRVYLKASPDEILRSTVLSPVRRMGEKKLSFGKHIMGLNGQTIFS